MSGIFEFMNYNNDVVSYNLAANYVERCLAPGGAQAARMIRPAVATLGDEGQDGPQLFARTTALTFTTNQSIYLRAA